MENERKDPQALPPAEVTGQVPPPEPPVFSPLDWLAVGLGLALGALWFQVFSLDALAQVPGAGTAAFVLAALTCEVVCLRGRLRATGQGVLLTACTVLLAVSCALFGDYGVRMINLALLAFLTPASALALAGRDFPALEAAVVPETLRLFLPNLFLHIPKPFRALRRRGRTGPGLWAAALTLVVIFPVLALILTLLSRADQVFGSVLGGVGRFFRETVWQNHLLWTGVKSLILGLMLFSFLWSLAHPDREAEKAPAPEAAPLPCLPFIAALSALDLIYGVFAVIQFVFLFGGAETAAMQGGYAQYARQGFFQLLAVAGINLLVPFLCVRAGGRGKAAVKVLTWLLLGLTAVILASAATRMCLYIGAYGLSLLRAMTLLVMAWIAVALLLAGLKTARPERHVFPALFAAFLVLWTGFSLCDIDSRVADFNRAAYERGALAEYDAAYVSRLGPDSALNATLPWPDRVLFPRD